MREQLKTTGAHKDESTRLEVETGSGISSISQIEPVSDIKQLTEENRRLRERIALLEQNQETVFRQYREEQELKPYQAELIQLQRSLEDRGKKMVIIFEGRSGTGKSNVIRSITRYMNAKRYRIVALGKPTTEEQSQWFYQKYIREFPSAGHLVLFDRSWYSRAMIEPVLNFCTDKQYQDFMESVSGFEKDLVNQGIVLIKLYFSVSREERQRRLEAQKHDPLQSWKLEEIDLEAEEHRNEFTEAKYEMLSQTHTIHAPWTIIHADNQHLARINAMKVILNSFGYQNLDKDLDRVPDPNVVVSGAYELEMMQANRLRNGLGLHQPFHELDSVLED